MTHRDRPRSHIDFDRKTAILAFILGRQA